jgi:hypothetical protein
MITPSEGGGLVFTVDAAQVSAVRDEHIVALVHRGYGVALLSCVSLPAQ